MPNVATNPQVKKESCHTALAIRRTKAGEWIQRSLIAFPPAKAKSFRLTIVVNFAVNVQPRLLLVRCEVIQYFHNVTNHFLTNSADESRAFRRDADHHFAAVISRGRAHHVAKIFETRDETARRSRGVPHFLRDLRHTEHFLAVEIREKKKLRERNVARREFLGQVQHETALHFQNDVGKPFGIRTSLIRRSSCKRGNRSRVQGDKTRNAGTGCQSCSAGLECGDPAIAGPLFKAQTCLRTPNARRASSIPDLNINNFICFQRLTDRDPQQRICLAQTKKRVRFLTTDRRELSVFESPADVMRSIAVVR